MEKKPVKPIKPVVKPAVIKAGPVKKSGINPKGYATGGP
jgi:hypothetical protein